MLDTLTAGTPPTRAVWPAVTAVWDCGPDALLPAPSQLTLRGLTRPGPGPRLGRLFMGGHGPLGHSRLRGSARGEATCFPSHWRHPENQGLRTREAEQFRAERDL